MTCESTSHEALGLEESRHEALKRHTEERKKMADFLNDDQRAGQANSHCQLYSYCPGVLLAFVLIDFHGLALNRVML